MGHKPSGDDRIYFDDLISMLDARRAVKVREQRRCAGFTPDELSDFKRMFDDFDVDRSGVLSAKEAAPLLEKLGLSSGTVEDRERVLKQIDKAKDKAEAAGVVGVGERGSGVMNFWELVQLLRLLYSHEDYRVLARQNKAAQESKFKRQEVDDFREVFDDWLEKQREFELETEAIMRQQNIHRNDGSTGSKDATAAEKLNVVWISKLLSSLGIKLKSEQRKELEAQLQKLADDKQVGFPDFLRLMRWILDTNFADMSEVLGR